MIKLPLLSLMIVSLLGTQTYALGRDAEASARAITQDHFAAVSMNNSLNQNIQALENSINTLNSIAQSEDLKTAKEEAFSTTEDLSTRQLRIKKRWLKRMDRSSAKLVKRYNQSVDSMSDEQALANADRINLMVDSKVKTESSQNQVHLSGSAAEIRGQMKAKFLQDLPKLNEGIATRIAKSGGLAFFVLHLKKQLKTLKAQLADHQKHTVNRAIASDVSDAILITLMVMSAVVFFVGFVASIDAVAYIALGAFVVNLGVLATIDALEY